MSTYLAKPGEVSVAVAAATRAVHDEKAAGAKPAFREQALDTLFERAVLHGRELVEQRRDKRWIDCHHENAESDPYEPDV